MLKSFDEHEKRFPVEFLRFSKVLHGEPVYINSKNHLKMRICRFQNVFITRFHEYQKGRTLGRTFGEPHHSSVKTIKYIN